jgi:GNAT superfamily N-acetyltransferase
MENKDHICKDEEEMIDIRVASKDDIESLMSIRLEMLKVVNNLAEDYKYSAEMITESRDYFLNGDHITVLAVDGDAVIGCATMSFIRIMPTFDHPTGRRAHLMNVYTRRKYRRQGIARKMLELLIGETWKRGATEISLDATAAGRPLYESMGFTDSTECMVLTRTDR